MSGELDALAAAVDALDLAVDTDVLAEVLSIADQLQAKANRLGGEIDAANLYEVDGATSMPGWLRTFGRMTRNVAASFTKVGRRLRGLPVTREAWESGLLSGGQVQVILANLNDRTATRFAECEAELVPLLAPLTMVDTVTAMQEWKRRAEAELDDIETPEPASTLHLSRTLAGRVETTGSFDADDGTVIETAIRVALADDTCEDDERTPAERRADAATRVHQFFLDQRGAKQHGRRRPHVDLVVRMDEHGHLQGELLHGGPLPLATTERLLCDCTAQRVFVDAASKVLDLGRDTRTVPEDQFNLTVLRDKHCRAYGCDCPAEYADVHHVIEWLKHGNTDLSNLVLLCRRHHKLIHQPGWTNELLSDGTYVMTDPRGRKYMTHPPGTLLGSLAA
jgi:5-methylcytosine-specific restriction protein A